MASVAAGQREGFEQPRHAMVEDGAVVAACLVAERAGDPALADAGRAGDQQVLLAADPVAVDELGEEGAIEAARRAQIDILDDGGLAQRGELQARDEPLVVALGGLAVDHQAEALLEGERGDVGLALLILEGLGHAGKPEGGEAFVGGVDEHQVSFCWSVVVATAADVGVMDGIGVRFGIGHEGPVEAGLEDRGDRAVGRRADDDAAAAGRLEADRTIGRASEQDAEAGAEALLGMRLGPHDRLAQRRPWTGRSFWRRRAGAPASSRRTGGARSACARGWSCAGA